MGLFKRPAQTGNIELEVQPNSPDASSDTPFTQFLDKSSRPIQEYSAAYSMVGACMLDMAADDNLRDTVIDLASKQGDWTRGRQPVPVEEVADRYMTGLPTLYAYAAKQYVESGGQFRLRDVKEVRDIHRGVVNTGIKSVDNITEAVLGGLNFKTSKFIFGILTGLAAAEDYRRTVAERYADTITGTPATLDSTYDFYAGIEPEEKAPDQIYLARNFRDILAADLTNRNTGVIHQTVSELGDGTEPMLQMFASETANDSSSDNSLGDMARMAADYAAIRGAENVSAVDFIVSTYDTWSQTPDVNRRFLSYATRKSKTWHGLLREVAGIDSTGRRRGIRMPVTDSDLKIAASAFGNLVVKRDKNIRLTPAGKAAKNFQLAGDVLVEAKTGGMEPKPMFRAVKTQDGFAADPDSDSLEKMIKAYTGNNAALERDVRMMVREISINPFPSERIKARSETIDGRKCTVWEFSPQDRNFSLKSGKEGKRTRITFSDTLDGILVYHILSHDDMDRIYK